MKYNDIVSAEYTYFKFLMYREDTGTCVVEDFTGKLYQFDLPLITIPTQEEVLKFLNYQLDHWTLMKQGAEAIIEEHERYANSLADRIQDLIHHTLPSLKENYEGLGVAVKLLGKHPDNEKLQDEYRKAKRDLDDAMFQIQQCDAAKLMSIKTIETNKQELKRIGSKLKLFLSFKEKLAKF